jgi:hypothetical protein
MNTLAKQGKRRTPMDYLRAIRQYIKDWREVRILNHDIVCSGIP